MAEVVVGINWIKIIQNIPSTKVEELVTGAGKLKYDQSKGNQAWMPSISEVLV